MKGTLTVLGSGNSSGVPAIFSDWGACDPSEPKNRRRRACAVVEVAGQTLVIDTGPDFREQANGHGLKRIDAVFYTHMHADHVNGIEELRYVAALSGRRVDVYGNSETLNDLQTRFSYMFAGSADGLYLPALQSQMILENRYGQKMTIAGIPCTPFEQDHGTCMSLGLRIGDTAYSTDMVNLDDAAVETLRGVKNWIVDGAGYKFENPIVHANLEKIYALAGRIGARQTWITSLSRSMDYGTLCAELPDGFAPAFDGLAIDVEMDEVV